MVARTSVMPNAGGEGLGRRDLYRDMSWEGRFKRGPYCLPWQGLLSCELLAVLAAGKCIKAIVITELTYGRPRRDSS
jgi:hypothetical protein